jgi:hypothetical protein
MNTVPPAFRHPPAVSHFASNDEPAQITLEEVRAFSRKASVSSIILNAAQSRPWRKLLDRLGRPHAVGGVLIYRLDRNAPGSRPSHAECGPSPRTA